MYISSHHGTPTCPAVGKGLDETGIMSGCFEHFIIAAVAGGIFEALDTVQPDTFAITGGGKFIQLFKGVILGQMRMGIYLFKWVGHFMNP